MSDTPIIPAIILPQNLRFDRTIYALIIILFLSVIALFSSLAHAGFIGLDDPVYVTNNPHVTGGLTPDNVAWAWAPASSSYAGYWIPLTWMSLQLDASLSNPAVPPPVAGAVPQAPSRFPKASVYHIDNVLQHALAAVFLFLFLWRATGLRWPAFAATLLWAVHPLRVESVAWVAERKDVLSGVLGFLALWLCVEWARKRRWWSYVACIVVFAMSLMAKPLFVSLPLVLVMCDYWPLGRLRSTSDLLWRVVEKTPLWILAIGASWLVIITQAQVNIVAPSARHPLAVRLGHATVSYAGYLWDHIHVWELGLVYPYKINSAGEIVLSAVVLIAITAVCIWQAKRRPWFLVGWFWYVTTMAPLVGIVQAGDQGSADRFTYRPSVGLFIMLVFGLYEVWQRIPRARYLLAPAAFAILAFFAGFTFWQAGFWNNTIALMNHSMVVVGGNFQMHGVLAGGYLREGRNREARAEFQKAVDLKPDFPELLSLASLDLDLGDIHDAIMESQKAAILNPRDPEIRKLHGLALAKGGFLKEAEYEFHVTVVLDPKDSQAAAYWALAKRELARKRASQRVTSTTASQPASEK